MFQWLGLQAFTAKGLGSIFSQGTKTVEGSRHGQKKGHVFYSIFKISFNIVIYLFCLAALGLSCSSRDLPLHRLQLWHMSFSSCDMQALEYMRLSGFVALWPREFSSPTRD